MMDELPSTWTTATVGAVSSGMQYGYTASASDAQCGPRFLRITDIQDGSVEWSCVPYCEIDQTAVPKYAVQDGDLLVARTGGTVGKSFLIRQPPEAAVFASDLIRISPSRAIDPRYWAHYFKSVAYWQQIGLKKGGLLGNVNSTTLASVELPLCPQPEQQRIVSKVDELFSRIDEGERALERVQKLVERYRQSVLKAAVTGELTREWREKNKDQLESGEALLARILKARREAWEKAELEKMKAKGIAPANDKWKQKYEEPSPPDTTDLPELPSGWVWASLDQLLIRIEAGKSFKCDERPPQGDEFGVVKVSAVTWGVYDEAESKTITDASRIEQSYLIRTGDFLFSRANTLELVGACVIASQPKLKLLLSDKILRFVFALDLKVWADLVLKSRVGRDQIERLCTGNQDSMRNIGQGRIGRIAIPLPGISEVEAATDVVVAAQQRASQALANTQVENRRSTALRQAVLQSAFGGQLVGQDPADEPAVALLERIAAERGTDNAAPKRGRKKKTAA